jgi:hypothetical protein
VVDAVKTLHQINHDFVAWAIDMGFASSRDACTVPYILTVRNAQTPQESDGSTTNILMRRGYFGKFYDGDKTSGMSLANIGRFLRATGSDESTHSKFLGTLLPTSWRSAARCLATVNSLIPHRSRTLWTCEMRRARGFCNHTAFHG